MKRAVVYQPGGEFHVEEAIRPVPLAGQVLIRVGASAVNPLDAKIRAGAAEHARHPFPATLGIDLAGTVEQVGPDVAGVCVGDEVMGMTGGVGGIPGSLAEYVTVDTRLLAPKPANLSMAEAAALPLAFVTAWEGLVDRARVAENTRVLVQSGAGGVGHMAVQLALALGARVYATGRASHRAVIEAAGAQFVSDDELAAIGPDAAFDVVFDTRGGPSLDASFRAVKEFGHVVSALGWGTHVLAPLSFRSATYSGIFTLSPLLSGIGIERLGRIVSAGSRLAEQGLVRPRIDPRVFTLGTVADAHRALEDRPSQGRVVVSVA
jgi:NADPH:quinone reductase-like Zn-dependent oxidoreductase